MVICCSHLLQASFGVHIVVDLGFDVGRGLLRLLLRLLLCLLLRLLLRSILRSILPSRLGNSRSSCLGGGGCPLLVNAFIVALSKGRNKRGVGSGGSGEAISRLLHYSIVHCRLENAS